MKTPEVLDKMADIVLAYRPPEKQKPLCERKEFTKRLSDANTGKRESKA